MTTPIALLHTPSSLLVDDDTAARIALTAAGVAGDLPVAIGIRAFRGASRLVAAVHDQRDAAAPLTPVVRERIRTLATADRVLRILEDTARLGVGILSPGHDGWPARVDGMRGAAPLLLWVRGTARALSAPSIAFAGSTSLDEASKQATIELATGLCSRGWGIVAGTDEGTARLALRSADAMNQPSLRVSPAGLTDRGSLDVGGVQVSEVPPTWDASEESRRRAKLIVVALAGKLLVDDRTGGASNFPMVQAAAAMRRPTGVLPTSGHRTAAPADAAQRMRALPIVRSVRDADLLH